MWPEVALRAEVVAPPIVEHGLVAVCSRRGTVYVINQFSGERLADLRAGNGECFALISNHTLVIAGDDQVTAYDLLEGFRHWSSGRFKLGELWRTTLNGDMVAHPINRIDHDSVLLVCVREKSSASVHRLDMKTGEPRWEMPVSVPVMTSAAVVDDARNAFLLAADQKVYRISGDTATVEVSRSTAIPLRIEIAPAWQDSTLYFFDEEGALCCCRTGAGEELIPARVSELTLLGIKGFAVSPRGVLVSHARGLTKLSLSGQLIWAADPSMAAMSSSPVLAGDCGFGVGVDRSVVYMCDFRGPFLRFHQFLLAEDLNVAPPAFAGNVLYTCSLHGELNALRVNTESGRSY